MTICFCDNCVVLILIIPLYVISWMWDFCPTTSNVHLSNSSSVVWVICLRLFSSLIQVSFHTDVTSTVRISNLACQVLQKSNRHLHLIIQLNCLGLVNLIGESTPSFISIRECHQIFSFIRISTDKDIYKEWAIIQSSTLTSRVGLMQ